VSNKDSDVSGEKGDPIEALLYATFVASTERADVASLAEVLNVDLAKLQEAVSIACRLGFGTRRECVLQRGQPVSRRASQFQIVQSCNTATARRRRRVRC